MTVEIVPVFVQPELAFQSCKIKGLLGFTLKDDVKLANYLDLLVPKKLLDNPICSA